MNKTTIIIGLLMLLMISSVSATLIDEFNDDSNILIDGRTSAEGNEYYNLTGQDPQWNVAETINGSLHITNSGEVRIPTQLFNEPGENIIIRFKDDEGSTFIKFIDGEQLGFSINVAYDPWQKYMYIYTNAGLQEYIFSDDPQLGLEPYDGTKFLNLGFKIINSTTIQLYLDGEANRTFEIPTENITSIGLYHSGGASLYVDSIATFDYYDTEETPTETTSSSSSSSGVSYAVDSEGNIVGIVANGQLITTTTTPKTTTTSPTLSILGNLGFNEPTSFNLVDWIKGYWNAWFVK